MFSSLKIYILFLLCISGDDDTPIIGKQLASDQDKLAIGSFKYLHVLGRGAFGKVLLAERKGTDEIYAVKVMKFITIL